MEIKEVFEPIMSFMKNLQKKEKDISKQAAKDRLKLVLMQDRASVSPDFFEMMKKEIIDVIKKYIEIDEESLEVELTRGFEDGLDGPALYANIPIKNIKPVAPGSDDELTKEQAQEISDIVAEEILDEASKKMENVVVKAEIESAIDEEDDEETHENDSLEQANIVEINDDNEQNASADVIAENVAKEMKKSFDANKNINIGNAINKNPKKTPKKVATKKKNPAT